MLKTTLSRVKTLLHKTPQAPERPVIRPLARIYQITFQMSLIALATKFSPRHSFDTAADIGLFSELLPIEIDDKGDISRLFAEAYEDTLPASYHAKRIFRVYQDQPVLFEEVMRVLIRLVMSHRLPTEEDAALLREVALVFGLTEDFITGVMRTRIISEATSPYALLELSRQTGLEDITQSYKRLVKTCHPDKLDAKVAALVRPLLKERFEQLTGAYDKLRRKRRGVWGWLSVLSS